MEKSNYGVEISLKSPDDFLLCKESLTRIGIPSKDGKRLYQSCHIFHKKGVYKIVHFLEMFILDGKDTTIQPEDYERRNLIASLLAQWGLCTIVNKDEIAFKSPMNCIKVLPFKEKNKWELISKYSVGSKKI
jgi:hypothetical protein